jgi:hypothetical protein
LANVDLLLGVYVPSAGLRTPRSIGRTPSSRRRFYAAPSRLLFPSCRDRAHLDSLSPCRPFFHLAIRFPKSALDLILCARFHKNKIAHYECGGCNMIEIEGDLQTNKKRREWPPAIILTNTTRLIVRLGDLRHAAGRQHASVAF